MNVKEIQVKENWEIALKNYPSTFFAFGYLTMGLCLWGVSVTDNLFSWFEINGFTKRLEWLEEEEEDGNCESIAISAGYQL